MRDDALLKFFLCKATWAIPLRENIYSRHHDLPRYCRTRNFCTGLVFEMAYMNEEKFPVFCSARGEGERWTRQTKRIFPSLQTSLTRVLEPMIDVIRYRHSTEKMSLQNRFPQVSNSLLKAFQHRKLPIRVGEPPLNSNRAPLQRWSEPRTSI